MLSRALQHSELASPGLAVPLYLLFTLVVCSQSAKRLLSSTAVVSPEHREGTTPTGQHGAILLGGCATAAVLAQTAAVPGRELSLLLLSSGHD